LSGSVYFLGSVLFSVLFVSFLGRSGSVSSSSLGFLSGSVYFLGSVLFSVLFVSFLAGAEASAAEAAAWAF
jgi:hypothetical protein